MPAHVLTHPCLVAVLTCVLDVFMKLFFGRIGFKRETEGSRHTHPRIKTPPASRPRAATAPPAPRLMVMRDGMRESHSHGPPMQLCLLMSSIYLDIEGERERS